jgi:hypothetical protein
MRGCVLRVTNRLCLSVIVLFFIAGSVHPQSVPDVTGRWVWKEVARKNKPQTQFTLIIYREGEIVRGAYSVDEFINGEWQGEDGNQTPVRGRVAGRRVQIEFDPSATVPGYEQDVSYKAPSDGRRASVAVLTFKDGTLLWHLVHGSRIESVPAKLTLHRERLPK